MGFLSFLRQENPPQASKATVEESVAFDDFVDGMKQYITKTLNWSKIFGSGKSTSDLMASPYSTISSVYKPVKAIIDNAPQAPLVFYNKAGEMVDHKELRERFDQPSPGVSYTEFIGMIVGYYALYGEVFIVKEINTVGEQSGARLPSLIVVNPKNVQEVVDHNTKALTGWKIGTKDYIVDDVICIKDFNPENPLRGLSPQKPLALEMSIDYFSLMYNKKFFENDASPGMTLETDRSLSEEQKAQLKEAWEAGSRGVKNAFKTRLLEGGLKVKQTIQSHKDMDFIEQKKLVRDEITGNWRVPKSLFNVTDSINYATFQGQMKMFWQYQISPMLRKISDGLNMGYVSKYAKGYVCGFDYKNVPAFAEDMKEKILAAEGLYRMGFTRNEINEELELGFEAKPWGDEYWVGAGLTPASFLLDPDFNPEPLPEPVPAKSAIDTAIDKAFSNRTDKHAELVKGFLRRHEIVEAKMARKVKRHFYNLRKSILELSDTDLANKQLSINWNKADDDLKTLMASTLKEAVSAGIVSAEDDVKSVDNAIHKDAIAGTNTESLLNSYLALRLDKITGINRTIRKMLLGRIEVAIKDGLVTGSTMNEIASGIRDVVRDYFNNAGVRSKMIARTEVTGAMNGGSLAYYKDIGCDEKAWLSANDENVRASHVDCDQQGWVGIDDSFVNGLQNPGDQDANKPGEVISCRCRLVGRFST